MEQLTHLPKLPSLGSFRNMPPMARREFYTGMLFLSPWLFGFIVFTLIPMGATLLFTFMDAKVVDLLNAPKWVGFQNYATLLTDNAVWNARPNSTPGAFWITLRFGLIALPVGILVPLGIAVLMNSKYLKAQTVFRSLFYMPYIIPMVASVFLWGGVLNPENGWINRILMWMGVPKANVPGWANDLHWVYPAYVIIGIWGIGNAMLTMLASMQSVPTDLYDAAKVDGAGPFTSFLNVTFPMISPVIFYNLVLSVVGLFQYFLVPLVINQGTGEPGGATMFYNLLLYKTFFGNQNMSYGATLAWMLFLMVLIVTVFLFYTARFWVYYASERN
jgi:ABC-type sugar transport system permease subunit